MDPTPRTGTVSGSTTDAYVVALSSSLMPSERVEHRRLGLAILNTGSKSLFIKITSRVYPNGSIQYTELDETEITAGSMLRYFENDLMGSVDISLKSMTAGQPTNYTIEWAVSMARIEE